MSVGVLAPFMLIVFLAFAVGWIAILVVGIRRWRKGYTHRGYLIFGALWGALVILTGIWVGRAMLASQRRQPAKSFDLASYKGPTGTLQIPYHGGAAVTLLGRGGGAPAVMKATTKDGTFKVPPGQYRVDSVKLTAEDAGGEWQLVRAYGPPAGKPVVVTAGQTTEVKVGTPVKVRVDPEVSNGHLQLTLVINGAEGGEYVLQGRGEDPKPPKFLVQDSHGRTLWADQMEYG